MQPQASEAPSADLYDLIARLADNKYFLGRRYAEWCSAAPTLEAGVAAAAMAQDELGHARALYPLLRDLAPAGADAAQNDPDTRTRHVNLAALDAPFDGWEDFVAANFLIDTALSVIFAAASTSTFEPLAGRSRKVLQEERIHALHGDGWVRRMARGAPLLRAAIEQALLAPWDEVLCWFGPAGTPGASGWLAEQRVLDAAPDVLRGRFLARIGPTVAELGLPLPLRRGRKAGEWALTSDLPWARWDAATYRLAPAEAAIPAALEGGRA